MRTPLTIQQLETAVFETYQHIEERTIKILTMSVQFRVRLCIARNGKFVGDELDECCHLADGLYEAATRFLPFPVNEE